MPRIDSFLSVAADARASDLHLSAGRPPMLRVDGRLVDLPYRDLSASEARAFVDEILGPAERERLSRGEEVELVHELPGVGRFRTHAFQQERGPSAVLRFVPPAIPTLESLGMPAMVAKLTSLSNGLVLVTGPGGSGKTTTVAAMVDRVNRQSARHVLTIEKPVEFLHAPVKSAVTQREVGRDALTWAQALHSALREAPDVIVVGDLCDAETVSLALSAAETGALVIGCMQTDGAVSAIERLVNLSPPGTQEQTRAVLSVLLRGVVAQRLVPRLSGRGRVAAVEVLPGNHAVANMIREKKSAQLDSWLQTASDGAQSMRSHLKRLASQGLIAAAEAA